jgi:acetyl-CoA synthetase
MFELVRTRGVSSEIVQTAREMLHWDRPFLTVRAGSFETGDTAWFPEGGLNASYNCVDRWAFKNPNKVRLTYYSNI